MRVTVLQDDGTIMVDQDYRSAEFSLPTGARVLQWNSDAGGGLGELGWLEYYPETGLANSPITDFATQVQPYIDIWEANAPVIIPPTTQEKIDAAKARIQAGYDEQVRYKIDNDSPMLVVNSDFWVLHSECLEYEANNAATVIMMEAFSDLASMTKSAISIAVRQRAAAYKEDIGQLLGMLQSRIDAIDALGVSPTDEQLDAIFWP